MTPLDPLSGWIPFYLQREHVHWGYMGQERFVEPFFQDTLQKLASRPFNQLLRQQTGLDILLERAISHPGLPLQGLIFHMSRCGSTLTTQALAALQDTVVLSEPVIFDTLLQWLVASRSSDSGLALLRGLLSALGQPRRVKDQRLFVKVDCWHICHIDRILSAFPGVPWVFLYRDPVEVLVSQARMPGLLVVPGALIGHDLSPPQRLMIKPLEHGAWVLGQVLHRAIEAMRKHPGGLLVNYSELPIAIETLITGHFGLKLNEEDLAALNIASARNAKNPYQAFQPDSEEKQDCANGDIRAMAECWLEAPYQELERMAGHRKH